MNRDLQVNVLLVIRCLQMGSFGFHVSILVVK